MQINALKRCRGASPCLARSTRLDWSDDVALGLAGFAAVLAVLLLAMPDFVSDLSRTARIVAGGTGLIIAGLLACHRTRGVGVMLGASASAGASLLLLLAVRFDLLPLSLGASILLIATAVRIDRRRQDSRPIYEEKGSEP